MLEYQAMSSAGWNAAEAAGKTWARLTPEGPVNQGSCPPREYGT